MYVVKLGWKQLITRHVVCNITSVKQSINVAAFCSKTRPVRSSWDVDAFNLRSLNIKSYSYFLVRRIPGIFNNLTFFADQHWTVMFVTVLKKTLQIWGVFHNKNLQWNLKQSTTTNNLVPPRFCKFTLLLVLMQINQHQFEAKKVNS